MSPGDAAPDFSLEGHDGTTYSLASMKGQRFVLYFYPRDNTPGCTQEACDFRDGLAGLGDLGVTVLGVSPDSIASHERFAKKYDLNFPLLSDPERAIADAYGALGEKSMYGRKVVGIIRSTFVIDAEGRIETAFSPVRVKGHVAAVLAALGAS
ncbi:MAG: thioredoxin-dependent thiol peroxidase [Myxococcota bacterium]